MKLNGPLCQVVITGAGSGFGRAIALTLAKRNAKLVLSDLDSDSLQETAQLARDFGAARVVTQLCDVTRLQDVQALASLCDGDIHLVVNNAGVATSGYVGQLSIEDWRWTLEVDLFGVIHGCHVFVPLLKNQQFGHILNVASAAGLLHAPMMAAYNAAKAGVVAISETLYGELAGTGVGVTVLCPTFFQTNIVKNGRFNSPETQTLAQRYIAQGPKAEKIAEAALRAIECNRFYCIPMWDGRLIWRLKRAIPWMYLKLLPLLRDQADGFRKKRNHQIT